MTRRRRWLIANILIYTVLALLWADIAAGHLARRTHDAALDYALYTSAVTGSAARVAAAEAAGSGAVALLEIATLPTYARLREDAARAYAARHALLCDTPLRHLPRARRLGSAAICSQEIKL